LPGEDDEGNGGLDLGRTSTALDLLGKFVAPSTVLVGPLYYFGWTRTRATYAYLGVDSNQLDLGPRDYLIRSPDAIFPLAAAFLLIVVYAPAIN
jgi:hypothetical protein